MVTELNRGIAVEDDRPDKVADAIQRLLAGEGLAGKLDLSAEAVQPFESATCAPRMVKFLTSLAHRRGDPGKHWRQPQCRW